MAEPIRLFVGGIPASISTEDISTRFEPFGEVAGVERAPVKLHQSPSGTNPNDCRGFAYVDLVPASDASVTKCCTAYNGAKWKGGRLRVEIARELYLFRLQKEWVEEETAQASSLPVSKKPETSEPKAGTQPSWAGERERKLEPMRLAWGLSSKTFRTVPAAGGPGTGKHKRSFQYRQPLSLEEIWSQATSIPLVETQKIDRTAETVGLATADRVQGAGAGIHVKIRTALRASPAELQGGMSKTDPILSRPDKTVDPPAKAKDVGDREAVEEGIMDMSDAQAGHVAGKIDDPQSGERLVDSDEENGAAAVAAERKRHHALMGAMFPTEGFKAVPVVKPSTSFHSTHRYDPGEQEMQAVEEEEEEEEVEVEEGAEVVERGPKEEKRVVKELSAWDKMFALAAGSLGREEEEEEEEEGEEVEAEEEEKEEEKVEEEMKEKVEEEKEEEVEEEGEEEEEEEKEEEKVEEDIVEEKESEAEEEDKEEEKVEEDGNGNDGKDVQMREEVEEIGGKEQTGGENKMVSPAMEEVEGADIDQKRDGGGVEGETEHKKRKWKGTQKKRARVKEGTDSGGLVETGVIAAESEGDVQLDPQASGGEIGEEKRSSGEWLEAAKWRALVNPSSMPEFRIGELLGGGIQEPIVVKTVMTTPGKSNGEEAPPAVVEAPRIKEKVVVVKEEGAETQGVCLFMRSPNAEKEWLASKGRLKEDYRKKQRAALRKGGIRVKGGVGGATL